MTDPRPFDPANPHSPVVAVRWPNHAPAGWVVFRSRRDGTLIAVMPGSHELDLMHREQHQGRPEWEQVHG